MRQGQTMENNNGNELNLSEKYLNDSKDRLLKIALKKIDTTMIGAISELEQSFSKLADLCSVEHKVTLQREFDEIRAKILNRGNSQKRNLIEEFNYYTIHWNRFQMNFRVIN